MKMPAINLPSLSSLWSRKSSAAPPRPQPVDSEPVDDLPLLDIPVSVPVVNPVRETAPSVPVPTAPPSKTPQVVGPYSRAPTATASPVPHTHGVGEAKPIAQKQDRASEDYARKAMVALPEGKLIQHKSGEPVTDELSAIDLSCYTKSKGTQKKVMDILASKSVITKRPNRAALVTEAYQYKPPVDPEEEAKKKQISEVESGLKNYGFKKSEAVLFANASTGDSVESHIENALKMAGSK